jgi:hypothetical protein
MKQQTLTRQNARILKRCLSRTFPRPLRKRARVRGRYRAWSPSPQSSPVKGEEVSNLTAGDKAVNVFLSSPTSTNASPRCYKNRKNFELAVKIGKETVAAILVLLCMVLPRLGLTAERKKDLRVTYSPPRISIEAQGVKLWEVLREVSLKVGFELTDYGIPDRDLTVSIGETTIEELLRQLLRGENYGVVYREKDRAISKVLLLSSPAYAQAAPVSDNQQARTEAFHIQEGLTVFSAAPSFQPARPEQTRKTRVESEPGVEDILRAHAMPGVAGSNSNPQNLTPNVAQPVGRSASVFSPTGAASTPRSLSDMNDSLATTTRLAQQNLKALVDGLGTATHSLLHSPAKK